MSVPTKQEMLDHVNTAIDEIVAGGAAHSYSVGGRNLQRYSLTELMDFRNHLQSEVNAESSAGTTNFAEFDR